MPVRELPVRPNLDQLRRQARELFRAIRAGDADALTDLSAFHPDPPGVDAVRLADAQAALARSYGASGWPRLVQSCRAAEAIWADDASALRALLRTRPALLHEDVLVRPEGRRSHWGPPMSYAANLGRDAIIRMLHDLGARDHEHAMGRAVLQSRIETARLLHGLAGSPPVPDSELGGAAYTLSVSGTAFIFELGGRAVDGDGRRIAPVSVVLETDSRDPDAKHAILEMYVRHGLALPDTPPMALHRGRIDLLEAHLGRDPGLLSRTFRHEEIYPPDLDCHDAVLATHGTPLDGATLLHMCCDYGEMDIAEWLIARGADVDARAAIDADGFGGHTPLFSTVVSQINYWANRRGDKTAPFTELLLAHGADPNARASLRKQMHPGYIEDSLREYCDVTPLSWGRRFHFRDIVSVPAMALIEAAGGRE